jgi:hypothetical protein
MSYPDLNMFNPKDGLHLSPSGTEELKNAICCTTANFGKNLGYCKMLILIKDTTRIYIYKYRLKTDTGLQSNTEIK